MTEKKPVAQKPEPQKTEVVEPAIKPKAKPKKAEPKTWHGEALFECPNCSYSTLDEAAYGEHMTRYKGANR